MRLLPKSEIAQRKADARKTEIDEGMRLARRVDALRETLANEEVSLAKFRNETVAMIHNEIKTEREKLTLIQAEVATLTVKREELLVPLDKEWQEVKKHKEELEIYNNQLLSLEHSLKEKEKEIEKLQAKIKKELNHAELMSTVARESLKEATDKNLQAEIELNITKKNRENAEKLYQEMTKELKQRDSDLATRERDCTIKETQLLERESALEKGWRLLEDRKATHERTITRLKQK